MPWPQSPKPPSYDVARARIAARRASQPPPRSWWDTASDFGGALKESGVGAVEGLHDMLQTLRGDPMTAVRHGQDLYDSFMRFRQGSNSDRAAQVGVGALEQGLGIPVSQLKQDWDEGNYAKLAGHSLLPLTMLGLGAKAGLKKGYTRPSVVEPKGLLPAFGETSPGARRFFAGEAGVADATTPYRRPVGNPNPMIESGTPTLADIGEVVPISPELAASGYGPQAVPPIQVGRQMTAAAAEARRQALGEKARQPKPAKKITKKEQERLRARPSTELPEPVQMPGFDRRTLFKPKDQYAAPQTPEPRYSGIDPNVPDVQPIVDLMEIERLKNAQARSPVELPEVKPVHPRGGETTLKKNFPENRAVQETLRENKTQTQQSGRPYMKLSAADLKTLAERGDATAIKEQNLRSKVEKRAFSGRRERLMGEKGEIDITAGVEKAKGQLKKLGKKLPSLIGDAQRGALLTGPAIAKSGIGAVSGLATELGERALTQSPKKTAGDIGKVVKSIPGGIKKAGRAARGKEDIAQAHRHLSDPGPFSKPAIRAMATMDAPFRHALESLGLSPEDALARILNASPKSQTGKDLITFLSRHPFVKAIVSPVGAVTSTNQIEQGLLRTPGVNMMKKVKKMDPDAKLGKQIVRGAAGVGAAAAGNEIGEEIGDGHYLVKGLLSALAGPYGLPMGLGMAFSSKDDLSKAIDNIGNTLNRDSPVRIPSGKITTEVERRFTPSIYRALTEEEPRKRRPQRARRRRSRGES